MPGAVPRTSTFALVNQTLPYALKLAAKGIDALRQDPALLMGLNTYKGQLTARPWVKPSASPPSPRPRPWRSPLCATAKASSPRSGKERGLFVAGLLRVPLLQPISNAV